MSIELATQRQGVLANVTPEALAYLTAPALSRNFLNLCQKSTKECDLTSITPGQFFISDQDKTRSVPVGSFGRIGGEIMGEIQFVYGAFRPKAVLFVDNKPMLECYDMEHPNFAKICGTREVKAGPGAKAVKASYGTEVLVYVPPHLIHVDALLTDLKRGLLPEDIVASQKRFVEGAICTFFFTGTNKENTCGGFPQDGGQPPNTPMMYRSIMKEGKSYTWWVTPIRKVLEITPENEKWIQKGISLMTPELINAFLNPPPPAGEAINNNQSTNPGTDPATSR